MKLDFAEKKIFLKPIFTLLFSNSITLDPNKLKLLHNSRFNLHRNWSTTIFIINLAVADFLYCILNLPFYALNYFYHGWFWGKTLCITTTGFRYINAFADWMCVAMIAVSRFLTLTSPALAQRILSGWNGFFIICLTWIYAVLLVAPMYLDNSTLGTFGYNCKVGKCDFVPIPDTKPLGRQILYGIGFSIPCILTTLSYVFILYNVLNVNKFLRQNGHSAIKKAISKREIKTTWTLFFICFSYFLFVLPITLINTINEDATLPELHLGFHCLYWLQYSLNFFIYAARIEQFRNAYSYFLKSVWDRICK